MKAETLTPVNLFGHHVRYVVPLFQRPYVWSREKQWEPLWDDVRTVAEAFLEAGESSQPAAPSPHFLGAIVLEQALVNAGYIQVQNIIDGQQRLTTLQILLDAAQLVVERLGAERDAHALRVLVLNDSAMAMKPEEVFKVWPTDRDQEAFSAAMDNARTVPHHLLTSPTVNAHEFFAKQITEWAQLEGARGGEQPRLHALAMTLRNHLKMVTINLEAEDNAQVIFESLNYRGAPLLAADLVKNLVFQQAQQQRLDVRRLYQDFWEPLDRDAWRQLVAQGRLYRPRIDVFLHHWLTMKLVREVAADRIYTEFRDHLLSGKLPVQDPLAELSSDARVYDQIETMPPETVPGAFRYRVLGALDTAVVWPFLLWLLRFGEDSMPRTQRDKALCCLESWLVRRALVRATSKDINKLVLELLRELDHRGPAEVGETVEAFLTQQTAASRFWPDDAQLYAFLEDSPIYRNLTRPRLRMVLEALEESYRTSLGEEPRCPRNLTIEHIMPQSWGERWPLATDDPLARARRDELVQSLGNLTLVNEKLNPALSNRPWHDTPSATNPSDVEEGKKRILLRHSNLKLNVKVAAEHMEAWTEADILARGREMIARICKTWPRPNTTGQEAPNSQLSLTPSAARPAELPTPPEDDRHDDLEDPTADGKYRGLTHWLREQAQDDVTLDFSEVEQIIGAELPSSARTRPQPWHSYEGSALGRAIRDAGWRATNVALLEQSVTFIREGQDASASA